jgi:hypothetical protein
LPRSHGPRSPTPSRTAPFRLYNIAYNIAVSKEQKDHIRLLVDLVPLACAALVIVGLIFGTDVVLLGHQAEVTSKPSVSRANVPSILIAPPQSHVLLPELSVGSITAKAAVNPTADGTPAHLNEAFALSADADSPHLAVSSNRSPIVRSRTVR